MKFDAANVCDAPRHDAKRREELRRDRKLAFREADYLIDRKEAWIYLICM